MAVMAREAWTDERLDDLNARVDQGFTEIRVEFRAMRSEMAANHRAVVQMAAGIWITALVGFLGVIGAIVAVVVTHG